MGLDNHFRCSLQTHQGQAKDRRTNTLEQVLKQSDWYMHDHVHFFCCFPLSLLLRVFSSLLSLIGLPTLSSLCLITTLLSCGKGPVLPEIGALSPSHVSHNEHLIHQQQVSLRHHKN
jgi:hypothetical protein